MNRRKYRFKRKDRAHSIDPLDDVEFCYDQRGPDYGIASDDTRAFGIEHQTVTLKEDGDYPAFTIPCEDLELVENS